MFPNQAPGGRTDTLELSYIPQMLAEYIQYKYTYSTDIMFRNPAHEGRTNTLQLSFIPQMLAEYIQYKYIIFGSWACIKNSTDIYVLEMLAAYIHYKYLILTMYIPQPPVQRAHRNPSTYIHPPCVGMIYPITKGESVLYSKRS